LTQAEDQGDAILVRQTEVDDQDVKRPIDRQPLRGLAIRRSFYLIPSLFQGTSEKVLYIEFVFDEKKPHRWIY
jgi:hypothetical protein